MIRFSAALVAVAIGVLIGGIATSELVLVYSAIVVSAVALAVLAIGVVLKRDELFGEAPGLVPAGAGTGPVLSARNETGPQDHAQFQGAQFQGAQPQGAEPQGAGTQYSQLTSPLPSRESAAPAAAASLGEVRAAEIARASAPASRPLMTSPAAAATVQAPAGRGWPADQLLWETSAARGPWASAAPDTRADWTQAAAATQAASASATASASASASPAAAPPLPTAPEPETQPTPSSWFDRLSEPAGPAGNAWSVPSAPSAAPSAGGPGPGVTGASSDEDDDEPVRYSWLDDIDDDATGTDDALGTPDVADADVAAPSASGEPTVAVTALTTARPYEAPAAEPAVENNDDQADLAGLDPAAALAEPDEAIAAVPAPAGLVFAVPESAVTGPGDQDGTRTAPEITGSAGAADAAAGPADAGPETTAEPATTQVAVIRGVPRYHEPDCILIRFMPEADIQLMSVPDASAVGCTPCAACQPPG